MLVVLFLDLLGSYWNPDFAKWREWFRPVNDGVLLNDVCNMEVTHVPTCIIESAFLILYPKKPNLGYFCECYIVTH